MASAVDELDMESHAIAYLKTIGRLTALVPVDMISGKLRRKLVAGDTALRVRRIGGLAVDSQGWLVRYRLQVDAFATTELEAFEIAKIADAELRGLAGVLLAEQTIEGTTIAAAVVTEAGKDLAILNSPDPDSDLERYLFGSVLYAHPATT